MRILCWAQHLSGVGHFVRMHAIARGLAHAHDVWLVNGGRPVPLAGDGLEPQRVELPALVRSAGRLRAVGTSTSVAEVLEARARQLGQAVERMRPDVFLIDHYPFSKWELEGEIVRAIEAARRANPSVKVFCSLRDIVPRTRHENLPDTQWEERVLGLLRARFDALLVHTDPSFTRLEEHFKRVPDLPLPTYYTGFVVEGGRSPLPELAAVHGEPVAVGERPSAPYAVLSCGGGNEGGSLPFVLAAIEAFRCARAAGGFSTLDLVVFPGPFLGEDGLAELRRAIRDGPFQLRTFSADFARWLERSTLSISRAGYNTVVQLLRAQVRSVLVPNPIMSDQGPRARRLAERGLATVVEGDPPTVATIAIAIEQALAGAAPHHQLNLDGVATTQALVEKLAQKGEMAWRSMRTSALRSTPHSGT